MTTPFDPLIASSTLVARQFAGSEAAETHCAAFVTASPAVTSFTDTRHSQTSPLTVSPLQSGLIAAGSIIRTSSQRSLQLLWGFRWSPNSLSTKPFAPSPVSSRVQGLPKISLFLNIDFQIAQSRKENSTSFSPMVRPTVSHKINNLVYLAEPLWSGINTRFKPFSFAELAEMSWASFDLLVNFSNLGMANWAHSNSSFLSMSSGAIAILWVYLTVSTVP